MFGLILCLLYTVSAQVSADSPQYSRMYLRGLKKLENERLTADYIYKGIMYVENAVLTAAKQGFLKYRTEPFEGCKAYSEIIDNNTCENIISGIKKIVSERFPDSEVFYNTNTKRYTIKWD